jgi:multicomponent Na+:H+ antiporter subunit D
VLPPLPIAIPLFFAAVVMAFARWMPRWLADGIPIAVSATVLAICVKLFMIAQHGTIVYWYGGWKPIGSAAIGISFTIDTISAAVAGFVALLFLLAFTFSIWYFEDVRHLYQVIMLVFLGAMCGFALTGDIFNMFVFFEMMSAAAFGLCAYKIEDEEALSGTINFAVTNTAGAFFLLFGISILYGKTGALNMAHIGASLAQHPPDGAVIAAFGLICLGLAVKGSIAPLHFWLDDAHAVAPTPLCILFSGIMVQIALYAIARIYWTVFSQVLGPYSGGIRAIFIAAGVGTILLGGFMAFQQAHLKRLLAFSTVSHSGIFLCAIGFLTPAGIGALIAYVIAHGLLKASLFMGSGILLHKHGTLDVNKMAGKSKGNLWGTALFFAGGLGLAGLPPFGNFAGKVLVEHAADAVGYLWIPGALILGSALDGGAVIKAGLQIYFGFGSASENHNEESSKEEETSGGRSDPPWTMTLPSVAALVLCLVLGAWKTPFDLLNDAGGLFTDTGAYHAAVFGAAVTAVRHVQTEWANGLSFAFEALTLVLLALFVWIALKPPRRLWRTFRAPIELLRKLHSGMFPDYMAWLASGAGAFAIGLFVVFRDRL